MRNSKTLAMFTISAISMFGNFAFAKDPSPLVISFQKQKNPEEIQKTAEIVAAYLKEKIGIAVEVLVPTSYGVTAQAMINNKVHVAYMDSLPFILASAEAKLEILAVEKRNGRTNYDSVIVVPQSSLVKNLADLKGKRFSFTSQISTSGYLFPVANLIEEKLIKNSSEVNSYFSQINYAGGYDKALLSVVNGQADAAAMSDYVIEGKKADIYCSAEVRNQVRILKRFSGVPTHLIAANGSLSKELITKIKKALMSLSTDKPELLSSVYGAAELVEANESHIQTTQKALIKTGFEVKKFVK